MSKQLKVGDKVDIIIYWLDCAGLMIDVVKSGYIHECDNIIHVYHEATVLNIHEDEFGNLEVIFKHGDRVYRAFSGMRRCELERLAPDRKIIFKGRRRYSYEW